MQLTPELVQTLRERLLAPVPNTRGARIGTPRYQQVAQLIEAAGLRGQDIATYNLARVIAEMFGYKGEHALSTASTLIGECVRRGVLVRTNYGFVRLP